MSHFEDKFRVSIIGDDNSIARISLRTGETCVAEFSVPLSSCQTLVKSYKGYPSLSSGDEYISIKRNEYGDHIRFGCGTIQRMIFRVNESELELFVATLRRTLQLIAQ